MTGIKRMLTIPPDADFNTLYQVSLAEWEAMPTIGQGHFDNLKWESERYRVWVTRCTRADYKGAAPGAFEQDRFTIEEKIGGCWRLLDRYGKVVPQ
jgi:hypothetical protein